MRCKTIETSIFNVNDNRLPGPLIIGTFEKQAPVEYGAGREQAGRRGKKEREVEVLKKVEKLEKLRNNTL